MFTSQMFPGTFSPNHLVTHQVPDSIDRSLLDGWGGGDGGRRSEWTRRVDGKHAVGRCTRDAWHEHTVPRYLELSLPG